MCLRCAQAFVTSGLIPTSRGRSSPPFPRQTTALPRVRASGLNGPRPLSRAPVSHVSRSDDVGSFPEALWKPHKPLPQSLAVLSPVRDFGVYCVVSWDVETDLTTYPVPP